MAHRGEVRRTNYPVRNEQSRSGHQWRKDPVSDLQDDRLRCADDEIDKLKLQLAKERSLKESSERKTMELLMAQYKAAGENRQQQADRNYSVLKADNVAANRVLNNVTAEVNRCPPQDQLANGNRKAEGSCAELEKKLRQKEERCSELMAKVEVLEAKLEIQQTVMQSVFRVAAAEAGKIKEFTEKLQRARQARHDGIQKILDEEEEELGSEGDITAPQNVAKCLFQDLSAADFENLEELLEDEELATTKSGFYGFNYR